MTPKTPKGGSPKPPRKTSKRPSAPAELPAAKAAAAAIPAKPAKPPAPGGVRPPIPVEREEIRIQFLQRPLLEPLPEIGVRRPAAPEGSRQPRRLAFVLHAHLPWVLGHGTWPHGEDWLAEAVVHCYLPLARRWPTGWRERGRRNLVAFEVTPILAAMLADSAHRGGRRALPRRTHQVRVGGARASTRWRSGGTASSSACAPSGTASTTIW